MWNYIAMYLCTIWIILMLNGVNSYGTGAPTSVCVSMQPGHGYEQNSVSPYTITVSEAKYTPGQSLTVTINGGDYQGILLQARVADSTTVVGTFSSPPPNTKIIQCSATDDSLTHSSTATKTASATYTWTAPDNNVGNVVFIATVAQEKTVWWKNIKSSPLTTDAGMTEGMTTQGNNAQTTAEGTTAETTTTKSADGTGGGNSNMAMQFCNILVTIGSVMMVHLLIVNA